MSKQNLKRRSNSLKKEIENLKASNHPVDDIIKKYDRLQSRRVKK